MVSSHYVLIFCIMATIILTAPLKISFHQKLPVGNGGQAFG